MFKIFIYIYFFFAILAVKSLMFNIWQPRSIQIKPERFFELTICLAESQLINVIYETSRAVGTGFWAVHTARCHFFFFLMRSAACGRAWYMAAWACILWVKTGEVCIWWNYMFFAGASAVREDMCGWSEQCACVCLCLCVFAHAVTFLMEQLWSQVTEEL